jgi:hypothetical protein
VLDGMSGLPGWENWAARPWYAFVTVLVLVAIIVVPGNSSSGTFIGAGVFLVFVAGAAAWAASVLEARQYDSKLVRLGNEHRAVVQKELVKLDHPEQQREYWLWVASCPCGRWSYSNGDETAVRDEARKHELEDYEIVKELR